MSSERQKQFNKSLVSLNLKKNRKKTEENEKNNEKNDKLGTLINQLKSSSFQIENMTNSMLGQIPLTQSRIIPINESNINTNINFNNNLQNTNNTYASSMNNFNLYNTNYNFNNLKPSNLNSDNFKFKTFSQRVDNNPQDYYENDIDTKIDFKIINYFQFQSKNLPEIKELNESNFDEKKIEEINKEKEENEKLKKEIESIKKLREEQEKINKQEDEKLKKKKEEDEKINNDEEIIVSQKNIDDYENENYIGLMEEEERLEKEIIEKEKKEKEKNRRIKKERLEKEKREKEEKEKRKQLKNNFTLTNKNNIIDEIKIDEISEIEKMNSSHSNDNNDKNKKKENSKIKLKSPLKKSFNENNTSSENESSDKVDLISPNDKREIEKKNQLNHNLLKDLTKEQQNIIEQTIKDVNSFDINHPDLSEKNNFYHIKELDKNEKSINNIINNFKTEIIEKEGKIISKQRRKNFLKKNYFEYKLKKNKVVEDCFDMNTLPHPTYMIKAFESCDFNKELPKFKNNFEEKIFKEKNLIENNLNPIGNFENYTTFVYKYSCHDNYKLMIDAIKTFSYWRKTFFDGNSFYRVFMFGLIENYILNNNVEDIEILFSELIYEKNIEFYKEENINVNKFLKILSAIRYYLKEKQNEKAYELFLKSYKLKDGCFDNALIVYLRHVVYKFLPEIYEEAEKKTKDKKQNFKDKIINLEAIQYLGIEPEFIILNFMIYLFNVNIQLLWIDNDFLNPKFGILNFNEYDYDENEGYKFPLISIGYFFSGYVPLYSDKLSSNEILQKQISESNISIKQLIFFLREKEKCKICNKTTIHIIFLQKNFYVCKNCLEKHIRDICSKRAINLLRNNFIGIEYSTKPIHLEGNYYIEEDDIIELLENRNLINELHSNINKICVSCKQIFDTNLLINLKCSCRYCQNCLIEKANNATKNLKILNKYEKETFAKKICECGNLFDVDDANNNRKDITDNDTNQAKIRMEIYIKTLCMNCLIVLQKFISENNINNLKTETEESKKENENENENRKESDNNIDLEKGKFESLKIKYRTIKLRKENASGKGLNYSDIDHIICEKCYYETSSKNKNKVNYDFDDDLENQNTKKQQKNNVLKIYCNICKKTHLMNLDESNTGGCCENNKCNVF